MTTRVGQGPRGRRRLARHARAARAQPRCSRPGRWPPTSPRSTRRGPPSVASWTPFGWAWALPFDVATGRWGSAVVHLVLAVAFVAALCAVWVRLLARTLTSPLTSSGGQRIGRGRLLPVLLGTSPTATIAARRVRAWYRDSRLVGIALRTAVLPVFFVVQAVFTRHPGARRRRHRHAGGLRRADPDERPRLRRPRLVAARRRRACEGWEDRLGRALASTVVFGPVVVLTYAVSVALGVISSPVPWLTVVVVVVPRQPRPGRRGRGGAPRARRPAPAATRSRRPPVGRPRAASRRSCPSSGPMLLTLPAVAVAAILRPARAPAGGSRSRVGTAYGLGLLALGVVVGGRRIDRRGARAARPAAHAQI